MLPMSQYYNQYKLYNYDSVSAVENLFFRKLGNLTF